MLRYLERVDERKQMRVRYEDFVRDPARTIRSILTRVGEHQDRNRAELGCKNTSPRRRQSNAIQRANTHVEADTRYIEEMRDADWSALTSALAPALRQFDYSESKEGMLSLLRSV